MSRPEPPPEEHSPRLDLGRIQMILAPDGDRLVPVDQAARLLRACSEAMPTSVQADFGPEVPPDAAELLAYASQMVATQTIEVCQSIPRQVADRLEFSAMTAGLGDSRSEAPLPPRGRAARWRRKALIALWPGGLLLALGYGMSMSIERGNWEVLLYQIGIAAMMAGLALAGRSAASARRAAAVAADALYYERRNHAPQT